MSSVRPHRALAALLCAAGLILTGCGTGFDAQTTQMYDAAAGSNARGGEVEVHNALFVANDNKTATMSATFLNKSKSRAILTGINVADESGRQIESTFAEPVALIPDELYVSGEQADAMITGTFKVGQFVTVTFGFEGAASISMDVPVVDRNGVYEGIATETAAPTPDSPMPLDDAEQATKDAEAAE